MAITTRTVGRVLEVTMDRPEARNAFDGEAIAALGDIFDGVSALDPGPPDCETPCESGFRPHAVLLRAEGPIFCAGGDLEDMKRLGQADFNENLEAARQMGGMFHSIRNCAAPVIARVHGPAYGGGVGLVCSCDIVVADLDAVFTFSEVRLGLVAGVIAPLVMGKIGPSAARHWFLTGDPIDMGEAARIGLVDRVAGSGRLDETVAATLDSVLAGGPEALSRIKTLVEGVLALGFERSLDFSARMIAEARTSQEAQAALKAFFAREKAPWLGGAGWTPQDSADDKGVK